MGRSRTTVRNSGMAARSSQLPRGETTEQKGQPGVRNGDVLWDSRYFPCALGSPEYVGEGLQKDGKAKGQFHRGRMQAKSY